MVSWFRGCGCSTQFGPTSRNEDKKFHIFVVDGRLPVMKLFREAEQTGWLQYARSNTRLSDASTSKLGVCTWEAPYLSRMQNRAVVLKWCTAHSTAQHHISTKHIKIC